MIEWLYSLVPLLKGLHIAGLCLWCGGLLTLPLMLTRHAPTMSSHDYRRIRIATHLTYTLCVTPAGVITVVAGTWLVFLRETFVPWFYVKLFFVALLVGAHAWIAHLLVETTEMPGRHRPPAPYLPVATVLLPVSVILVLVLGKPDLGWMEFGAWLPEPIGRQLPFEIPR